MKQLLFLLLTILPFLPASSQEVTKVEVKKPGTLHELLTKAQQDTCQSLIVSGKINSADIKVLRRMAGAEGSGKLQYLDMKDARIVKSDEPYLIVQNAEEAIIPWADVEYGSTNLMGGRDMDENGGFLVEVLNANVIMLDYTSRNLTEQEIYDCMSRWKIMIRKKLRIRGHRLESDKNGHYTYTGFTRNKLFCKDMIYHCTNLRMVITPSKGNLCDNIDVIGSPIRYMEVAKVIKK